MPHRVAALLATCAVAAVLSGAPPAAAAGNRSVSTSLTCTPSTLTVGSTTNCTFVINDTASGPRNVPNGTGTISVDAGTFQLVTPCVIAATSGSSRESRCTATLLFQTARTFRVTAAFTPDADDDHRAATRTTSVVVGSSSQLGIYVGQPTSTAARGSSYQIYGHSCAGGHVGQFVAQDVDPIATTGAVWQTWTAQTAADGSFSWSAAVPAGAGLGTFKARFYCASEPVTTIDDPAIQSMMPVLTVVVQEAPVAAVFAAAAADAPVTAAASTDAGASLWVALDTGGLPAVDRVGIPGAQMAQLTTRVDGIAARSEVVTRLAIAFRDRVPDRAWVDGWTSRLAAGASEATYVDALATTTEYQLNYARLSNRQFVDRAHQQLLGRSATTAERAAMLAALTSRSTTRPALLAGLASSAEHRDRTAVRGYVLAAYQELTPVMPSAVELDRFVAQLRDGAVRVQVLEDLALTRASTDRWIAGLAAAPATARF